MAPPLEWIRVLVRRINDGHLPIDAGGWLLKPLPKVQKRYTREAGRAVEPKLHISGSNGG